MRDYTSVGDKVTSIGCPAGESPCPPLLISNNRAKGSRRRSSHFRVPKGIGGLNSFVGRAINYIPVESRNGCDIFVAAVRFRRPDALFTAYRSGKILKVSRCSDNDQRHKAAMADWKHVVVFGVGSGTESRAGFYETEAKATAPFNYLS